MLGLLAIGVGAYAQAPAAALDLRLPEASRVSDPPGRYYGDTGSRTASGPAQSAIANPDAAQVRGSVTTGIGYSRRYGTSHFSAADLNVSKGFGESGENTLQLQISVDRSDGPAPYHEGYGRRMPPYPADMLPPAR